MRRLASILPFALWCAIVAAAVPRHEPWFDEVHAWMLARGNSLPELLVDRMRYEGSPALWHLILWPFAHAGLPVVTVQVIGALAAAAGVFLVLFRSPLPWALRLLLPFSYFFLYQYAVVARSYCLLLPMASLCAMAWPRRFERPGRLVAALALLLNVSLHGALIACGAAASHALDLHARWPRLDEAQWERQRRAAAIFTVIVALVVLQLWIHGDQSVAATPVSGVLPRIATGLRFFDAAFAENVALTVALCVASAWWFYQRGALRLWVLTTLPLLVLVAFVEGRPWHQGAPLVAWVLAAWVSSSGARQRELPALAATIAASIVLLVQVPWTAATLRADWDGPYSGSRAAGRWLASQGLDRQPLFGVGFASYAVLPYTSARTFTNAQDLRPYWMWTRKAHGPHTVEALLEVRPEWAVLAIKGKDPLPIAGYDPVADFPGALLFKGRAIEPDRYVILHRRLPVPDAPK